MCYSERSNHARFICSILQPTPSTRILHTGQRVKDELISNFGEYVSLGQFQIEHIQVADSPGRHEPGTGEIHYLNVLGALDALGYQGYVGLEYNPTTSSEASFAWLPGDRSGMLAVNDLRL